MIIIEEGFRVIRIILGNAFITDGTISEETKSSLKTKFKFETKEERQRRYDNNYKELIIRNKQEQLSRDIENTMLHRLECTCHACIRMKERGFIKENIDWKN